MQRGSERRIRIGVIGVGGWGTFGHLTAYRDSPHAEVVAICDAVPERLRHIASEWNVERAVVDYRDLLAMADVDAVDVCTPNNAHREIVLAAFAAGKHVMCEKPLALTVPEAAEMAQTARQSGLCSAINFVHRYRPAARYVKQLIQEGALGRIFHCNLFYEQGWLTDPHFPRTWRLEKAVAGSGVLIDLGIHLADLARWWLEDEVTSVSGRLSTFTPKRPPPANRTATQRDARPSTHGPTDALETVDVDDEATWMAAFAGGTQGLFFASRNATARPDWIRAEIYGSDGALVYDNDVVDSLQVSLGAGMWRRNAWGTVRVPGPLLRETGRNSTHYFAQDVATGSRIAPTFDDGVRAQAICEAVERSWETRGWQTVGD